MKRILVLAGLAVLLLFPSFTAAQESLESQLDFVRKLRAKGYLDLAAEHLELLRKNPDPGLQALVPLEGARISIALARTREPDQRPGLFLSARKDLQAFVDKNPGRPEAAQARLEIARLAAFQGDTLLAKALREDDGKTRTEQARKAETQFIQAGIELEGAAKQLADMAASYKNPDAELEKKVREQLQQDAFQARFDRAANIISRARTYLDDGKTDTLKARGELIIEAIKSFQGVIEGETPLPVKRLAEAWIFKCYQEIQSPTEARKYFFKVYNDDTKAAQHALRLARLFNIQGMFMHLKGEINYDDFKKVPAPKLLLLIQNESLAWLKAYPSFAQTTEGMAVQFQLANAYYMQGEQAMGKDPKDKDKRVMTPAATKLFTQSLKYFTIVADSDSEHAEDAAGATLKLSVDRIKDLELHQIKNFDDCFLKARYEMFLLKKKDQDNIKDPNPKSEKNLKESLRKVIAALQRAQNLADAKTPPAKMDEVRYFLMSAYLISGDIYRAAVAGEALGRALPATKRAPVGAAYGIEAYAAVYNKDKDEGNRLRLKSLANFVLEPESQKAWSSDPVTSVARYQLALLFNKDNEYKDALEQLEKLPLDFSGYVYATGQAVFIALEAKEKAKDPADQAFYTDHVRRALARMPPLPREVDPSTAAMYFHAQLEKPKFLYAEAAQEAQKNELIKALQKYQEMLKFIDQTQAQLDKLPIKLTIETKDRLNFSMEVLRKYARLGQSDIDYRQGRYDNVVTQTAETLKAVEAKIDSGVIDYGDFMKLAGEDHFQKVFIVGPDRMVAEMNENKLDKLDDKIKKLMRNNKVEAKVPDGAIAKVPDLFRAGKVDFVEGPDPIRLKDHDISSQLLGLRLRAKVQKGDIPDAKKILQYVDRIQGLEGNVNVESNATLYLLIQELKGQIDDLKKFKDEKTLKETIANFSGFADALAQKPKLETRDYIFLANFYNSLNQYKKAADLYSKVPRPKILEDFKDKELSKDPKEREAIEKEIGNYWYLQIEYAKALRLGKEGKKDPNLNNANKILDALIKHRHGRFAFNAKMEQNFILMDSELYGTAIKKWGEFMNDPILKKHLPDDPKLKRLYFDAWYHNTVCWYKYSQTEAVIKGNKEKKFIESAAILIIRLENAAPPREGWDFIGEKFRTLLDAEPKLKEAYENLKKAAK